MSARRRMFVIGSLVALAAFFAVFLAWPILYVLKGSVTSEGRGTLEFFRSTFADPVMRRSIVNSLMLGVVVTLVTTVVALPLALVSVRRDFAGRKWVSALAMLPLILPPFVGAIGMRQMFARGGSVNLVLDHLFYAVTWCLAQVGLMDVPWHMPPIAWMSDAGFWGVVVLSVLHLYPIMYLNVAASLASVDRSQEEAAYNLGASRWNVFRRITFPMMLPGYFAGSSIVFIWAFTDLGTPLVLRYWDVIPVQIFNSASSAGDRGKAGALVVMVLLLTTLAFVGARLFVRLRSHGASTKGTVGESLKRATPGGTALIWVFLGLLTFLAVIPHVAVVLTSLSATGGWNDTVLPTSLTFEHYGEMIERGALHVVGNSMLYSLMATGGALVMGVLIAWLLTRESFRGRSALDATVMMPLALPGIILAYGYLMCFVHGPLDPMGNAVPLLVIGYIVRRLPYMVRAAVAGFQHVSASLEEASRNLGAGAWMTLRRITLPLVLAGLVAGAVLTFVFSMFEVSQSVMLAQNPSRFPITRMLYKILAEQQNGEQMACAVGVLGMFVLAGGLLIAGRFLGRRMGEIFRA